MDYYNDNDPHAAAWLRNLRENGLIPEGIVDERPIQEVKAADLAGIRRFHAFAGIGGWAHALQLAGWPAARPVWTASLPCQPFSTAGKRKGRADKRHLWPVFFRLLRECRPPTLIGEQVASDDGYRWLARVRDALETEGYAVGCADLPAACVGSPHIRQRLFWVAVAEGNPAPGGSAGRSRSTGTGHSPSSCDGTAGGLADTGRSGVRPVGQPVGGEAGIDQGKKDERKRVRFNFGDGSAISPEQRAIIEECGFWPGCERTREGNHALNCPGRKWGHARRLDDTPGQRAGHAGAAQPGGNGADDGVPGAAGAGSAGGLEHTNGQRREAGAGAGAGGITQPFWADFDLVPCRDGKVRRVEPGSFPLVDGSAFRLADGSTRQGVSRAAVLRGIGNAIVAQVAAAFVRAFLEVST